MTRDLIRCVAPLAGVVVLWGCGGSEPQPVAAPAPAPAIKTAKAPAEPATEAPPTPAPDKSAASPTPSPALANPADAADLFHVEKDPVEPTFIAIGPAPDVDESDLFAVEAVPPAGADSTTFRVPMPERVTSVAAGTSVPAGFTAVPEAGVSPAGLPLRIRCGKDGKLMALVPAGPAVLGADDGPPDAAPRVVVTLDAYYIDVTEVTLGEYEAVREAMLADRKGALSKPLNEGDPEDQPAVGVSWRDAMLYCRYTGKQLPTEAQWEKAARGEDGYTYPWGDGRPIWPTTRPLTQVTPVMSYRADRSVYGVYDMVGNVREWTADWYSDQGHKEAAKLGESALRNWGGVKRASKANQRVVKGNGPNWEAWSRTSHDMSQQVPGVGFRCVVPADAKKSTTTETEGTGPSAF